jgi:hypothetical protein
MLKDAFNVTNYFRTINFRIVTDFSLTSSNSLAIPDYWLKIDEFFYSAKLFSTTKTKWLRGKKLRKFLVQQKILINLQAG